MKYSLEDVFDAFACFSDARTRGAHIAVKQMERLPHTINCSEEKDLYIHTE